MAQKAVWLNTGLCLFKYCKSSVKPPPPGGVYLFQAHFRVAYLRGDLFNFEKTMVLALHKELEYNVKKLNKKVGGHAAKDQNQI